MTEGRDINLVTVTYRQVAYIHVGVDLEAGTVYGDTETEVDYPRPWKVRDENGLTALPGEALKAIDIADRALPSRSAKRDEPGPEAT
jgi:hypothetical protein